MSADVITIACGCAGRNPGCVNCAGSGKITRKACRRCSGTGRTGGTCVDCQGQGWRELDNPLLDH